ncbi:AbrB/MazE/SpoVT family DNA-binding domain-containing protein [Flexivirga alba]|uniref:AbrB/MazE/SpoVT family DNA-binding domain-containing protein n=1 Tax=Flexivirga alba TaxID=702742 RepID=A0ABW2ALA1_9MICO
MRLNSKGQVTIPAKLRAKHGFVDGDEVDVIEEGDFLRIVHSGAPNTRGERLVARMRGKAGSGPTTDELMALLRDD